jgi:hypothetical protein
MSPRVQRAIDIFLDAINNNTLQKGDCRYCAVGNLCRVANIPHKSISHIDIPVESRWRFLFETQYPNNIQSIRTYKDELIEEGERVISYLEFSEEELRKIENTFETNTEIINTRYDQYTKEEIRADQIKGLEAVVKVMLEFDDCKESVNEVFTKKAELIPV